MIEETNSAVEEFKLLIERLKEECVYEYLLETMKKVYWIYNKRFGNAEYAQSIEIQELSIQVEDCFHHFICTDENTLTLVSKMNEDEQAMIIAAIIQFIIETE